ncbi:MAG: DUF4876 domain-containing protein [Paludibacteraceae bacterium]|nr:DUF4876 domain-containing protein [Paludibacteraceae bacterium]
MRNYTIYSIVLFAVLMLAACHPEKNNPKQTVKHDVAVTILLPDTTFSGISDAVLTVKNINLNTSQTFSTANRVDDTTLVYNIRLEEGFYDFTFSQEVLLNRLEVKLKTYCRNVSITETCDVPAMRTTIVYPTKDFVIAEVYFSGSITPEGKQYNGDKYFVLYNNSDSVLYADGLVLVESEYMTVRKEDVTPDMMDSAMTIDAIYRVGGNGKQHPVAPGKTFLIVDNAIDHRTINSNSFDLSQADVEWYDESTNAYVTDIDNPEVENMEKIYCYTLTIWVPHNQGHKAFAIGRIPAEQYLQDYFFKYDYQLVTDAGTFDMSSTAYLFPNEWIIDAVNTAPATTYQWQVTADYIDAGYTYVADYGQDKTRYGKSVRRKQYMDDRGVKRLQDTNNSTEDFLTAQQADPYYFHD